jgi:hypothetical protein
MDMKYHWLADRVHQKIMTFIGHQGVKVVKILPLPQPRGAPVRTHGQIQTTRDPPN